LLPLHQFGLKLVDDHADKAPLRQQRGHLATPLAPLAPLATPARVRLVDEFGQRPSLGVNAEAAKRRLELGQIEEVRCVRPAVFRLGPVERAPGVHAEVGTGGHQTVP
jgi:hypothetical protein